MTSPLTDPKNRKKVVIGAALFVVLVIVAAACGFYAKAMASRNEKLEEVKKCHQMSPRSLRRCLTNSLDPSSIF